MGYSLKSYSEIADARKKRLSWEKNPKLPFAAAFSIATVMAISAATGCEQGLKNCRPITTDLFSDHIPEIIFAFVLTYVIGRFWQLRVLDQMPDSQILQCIDCGNIFDVDTVKRCDCGGALYLQHKLKWEEDRSISDDF